MSKRYFILGVFVTLIALSGFYSHAQTTVDTLDPFKIVSSTVISPRVVTNSFRLPYLGSTSNPCLYVKDSAGNVATTTCASGSSSATTTINGLVGPAFTFVTTTDPNLRILITASTTPGVLVFTPVWDGILGPTRGGTGRDTWVEGDLVYADGANSLSALGIGSDDQFLRVSGGFPAWQLITTSDVPEGSNLYYTDARARSALSAGAGITYSTSTGVIASSLTTPVSYANGGTATSTAWTRTAVIFAGDNSLDQSYTPSDSSFVFAKQNASVGIRDNRAYGFASSSDLFSTALHVNGRGLFSGGRSESLDGSPAGAVIGYLKASDYAFLDGYQSGVGPKSLVLQPSGGSLGIGSDPISTIKLGVRVDQALPGSTGSQIAVASRTGTTTAIMAFGYTKGTDPWGAGYLQGEDPGNAYVNLLLQPRGGKVGIGTGTTNAPTTELEIVGDTLARSSGTNTKPLVVKGFAGQSVDLTQWQNSTSTVLSVVDRSGRFGIGTSAPTSTLQIGTPSDSTNHYLQFDNATSTPTAGDCTAGSVGRAIFFATSTLANEKLYICGVDASNNPTWTSAVFN